MRRVAGLCLALSLLAATSVAAQQWYVSYERAEEALAAGDWGGAIEQLNAALEKKSDSSLRARTYGMNFTEYLPYMRLAEAYLNLGDLETARQALETEERLGEVQGSEDALARLQALAGRIDAEQRRLAEETQQRVEQIVAEALGEAERLGREGRLEEALAALDDALAVMPDHPEATREKQALLSQLAASQRAENLRARQGDLIAEGRSELGAGRLQEAAALFGRALDLASSDEARSLLEQTQAELRDRARGADEQRRRQEVEGAIGRARALLREGDLDGALAALQGALALEPANTQALELQADILQDRAGAEAEASAERQVTELLAEVLRLREQQRIREALAAANRVLAVDPGNQEAAGYIAELYRQLNQSLLGGAGQRGNLPPAFSIDNVSSEALADGLDVERVVAPRYQLSGSVFDHSAVGLEFVLAHYAAWQEEPRQADREEAVEGSSRGRSFEDVHITNFSLERRLDPGLNIFRLVATDEEGLSSTSSHAVLYVQPFYRSNWFLLAIGVGLAGLVALVVFRRVQRRNEALKRRFNPYIAGAPVLQEGQFVGRDDLMERVLQTVHNNSILLYGERRIGKTSFQHRLKRRLQELKDPDFRFFPVYVDLQGVLEDRFFRTLGEDVVQELEPLLGDFEPQPGLHGDGDYGYRELVRDLRAILGRLQEQCDRRAKVVLLIDEVDQLNSYDPRVNQRLRSLFMKSFAENLAAVVSGVGIKKRWESEGSPWYNFFEEVPVPPFDHQEARELVERPIRGTFDLEKGVTDRIIEMTDGRPYLIQKMCIALVHRLHQEGRRKITLADVEEIGPPEPAG